MPSPAMLPSVYHGYGKANQELPPFLKLPRDVLNLIVQELVKQKAPLIPLRFVCKRIATLPQVQAEKATTVTQVRNQIIKDAAENAISQGTLTLAMWYHDRLHYSLTASSSENAARSGNPMMLQWLLARKCPWDSMTCHALAREGRLEVLQWARANGCPWNKDTCKAAAKGGYLEILQWARANGCPWDEDAWKRSGSFPHVRQWLRENGCPGSN